MVGAASTVIALLVPAATAGASSEVTAPPTLVNPTSGAAVTANPVFSWDSVVGALRYDIQVATDSAFTQVVYNATTYQLDATPTSDLPTGTLYWEVAGIDTNGNTGPYATSSFTKEPEPGPTLTAPADGASLQYPKDLLVLSWLPLEDAASYNIEISTSSTFETESSYSTDNTSYALTDPQSAGTYYWRVQAVSTNSSVVSNWSSTFDYTVVQLAAPNLLTPADNSTVTDIVFSWQPEAGAAHYELQVSPNNDFTNNVTLDQTMAATQFSPPTTFKNGSYYWRVRGVDSDGHDGTWSTVFEFTRAWLDSSGNEAAPAPLWPGGLYDPSNPGTPTDAPLPTFVWKPVSRASHYLLDVGTDSNFSPGTYSECSTNHVTFTSDSSIGCVLNPGTTYYWRVIAVDDPSSQQSVPSPVWWFTYFPNNIPVPVSPTGGATVYPPTLTWTDSTGSSPDTPNGVQFKVSIVDSTDAVVASDTTYADSWTPTSTLSTTNGTGFSWYVQTVTNDGHLSPVPPPATWATFTLGSPTLTSTPDPISPTSYTDQSDRLPSLSWEAVTGASYYQVWLGTGGTNVYYQLGGNDAYPATTFDGTQLGSGSGIDLLNPGEYDWYVEAFTSANALISEGTVGHYSIVSLAPVAPNSYEVSYPSLSGDSFTACPSSAGANSCQDTPTLSWGAVADAGLYLIYIAADQGGTNLQYTFSTQNTIFTPPASLRDSQAGQTYYWFVRPCQAQSVCNAMSTSFPAQFTKASAPVAATTGTAGSASCVTPIVFGSSQSPPLVVDQPTLCWTDYLATGEAQTPPVFQEAATYNVQVSTASDFSSIIDSASVDQTTYTPTFNYPNETLYWRVQATDASGNALTYSSTFVFTKQSSSVSSASASPAAGATVGGVPLFEWTPIPYAARYQVQVVASPNTPCTSAPSVLQQTVVEPVYTPTGTLQADVQYGWGITPIDSGGNLGSCTNVGTFTVVPAAPTLTAPANGATISPTSMLLSWSAVAGAVRYQVQTSTSSSFGSTVESVQTVMQSWATTQLYGYGTYYWRVETLDASNDVLATSVVDSFTVSPTASQFVALSPYRLFDTRYGTGGVPVAPVGPGATLAVQVTGVDGIPADATAVALNITAVDATQPTFVTAWPDTSARPLASNLNVANADAVANFAIVPIGGDGKVDFYNSAGSIDLLADVNGYYTSGPQFTPVPPVRVFDTRPGSGQTDAGQTLQPGGTLSVQFAGVDGVPAGVSAVALNITAVDATQPTYITAWPDGSTMPLASNVNVSDGNPVPNFAIVPVGSDGKVDFYNAFGTVDLLADLSGYFVTGNMYEPLTPYRVFDTRAGTGGVGQGTVGPGQTIQVNFCVDGVTSLADAVAINITAVNATQPTFITAWPDGQSRPTASNLNLSDANPRANFAIVTLGSNCRIDFYNAFGSVNLLADLNGYFNPS